MLSGASKYQNDSRSTFLHTSRMRHLPLFLKDYLLAEEFVPT